MTLNDLWIVLGIMAVTVAALFLFSRPATCSTCIATPCGDSSHCDSIAGCHCFVPVGRGTGYCG